MRKPYDGVICLKRLITGMTAALLAVILLFSVPSYGISAKSAVLMDCATGRILFHKDMDRRSLIASTTKIMTALIVCEQCNVLDRMKVPKEAVGIEGSSLYLQEGEILTIQELLYGLMLHSGNDAAVALAIYCGGTVEDFVQLMNDKARILGLRNTHFENPNGLDAEDHYSTAEDLGILSAYAMENPIFEKIVSTKSIKIGTRYLKNHNKLLWMVEGADGIKTGYTRAAGRILVSSAVRQGRRLVAVTICAPDDWQDHSLLLENGFSQYDTRTVIEKNTVLGTTQIAGGMCDGVELVAKDSFSYALRQDEEPKIILPSPGFVYAPVAEGQDAGYAQVYLGNQRIGSVPLTYGQTVEQEFTQESNKWQRLFRRGKI